MYKYVRNSVVKISMMFAKYFEYYNIILMGGGRFLVDMLYFSFLTTSPAGAVAKYCDE